MPNISIAQLIAQIQTRQPVLNADMLGEHECQRQVSGIGALDTASGEQLSFLANARFARSLGSSRAAVVIITPDQQPYVSATAIALHVKSPYLAYASVSQLFDDDVTGYAADAPTDEPDIHHTACVADEVQIGKGVRIGAYAVIDAGVVICDGCVIGSQVHIGAGSRLGTGCVIKPHVVIAHDCVLGEGVRVHAHASIGSEGFGFAPTSDPSDTGWQRIAQLGRVIIGNQVRIGSHTCIDRGAIADTVIGDHVIIDNLVQIAHNVQIGAGTAIAAHTGIAGSTQIGKRCVIGGAVGITGHIQIADDVTITGRTMVTKSIKQAGSYSSGTPAMPTHKWRKAAVRFRQVD